jgi:hypothetical protein
VLPAAIPSDEAADPDVSKFATSAPPKTPGQSRSPPRRRLAIAIPVGGHTGVMLACTEARERASRAATT